MKSSLLSVSSTNSLARDIHICALTSQNPPTDMEKELLRRITSLQRENFSQESKIKMLEAELKGANAQIERLEVGMGEATHVEDQANNVD